MPKTPQLRSRGTRRARKTKKKEDGAHGEAGGPAKKQRPNKRSNAQSEQDHEEEDGEAAKKAKAVAKKAKGKGTKAKRAAAKAKAAAKGQGTRAKAAAEKLEDRSQGKGTRAKAKPAAEKPKAKAAAEKLEDRTTTAKTRLRPFSESCKLYKASRARTDKKEVVPTDGTGSEDNTTRVDATPTTPAKVQRNDGLDAITPDKVDGGLARPLRRGKGMGHPTKKEMNPASFPAAEATSALATPPATQAPPQPAIASSQTALRPAAQEPAPDVTATLGESATLPGKSCPGVEAGDRGKALEAAMTAADKKSKWAQFIRTFNTATARPDKTEKVPPDLAQKMLTIAEKKHWYYIWLEEGSWSKVVATETFRKTVREVDTSVVDWLTEKQLEDFYKDPELAKAHKEVMQQKAIYVGWKPHPDLPNLAKATQFAITISSAKRKEVERLKANTVTWQGEIDPEGASRLSSMLAGDLSESLAQGVPAHGVPVPSAAQPFAQAATTLAVPDDEFAREVAAAKAAAEEKRRLKEGKEAAKVAKRNAEKQAKETDKLNFQNSNAGKAKKASDELQKELEKNVRASTDVTTSVLSKAMKSEWAATFVKHAKDLKKHLKHLERVEASNADDGEAVIEQARKMAELFKRDLKGFLALTRAQARAPV